jgi:ankyrin repeat protein
VVKVLLQYGADTLEPALEIMAGKGRLDLVRLLLEHGAECGEAVERAAAGSYPDVVEELLSRGADVKSRSADLLVNAVQYEHVAMFRLLMERGCDVKDADTMARCVKAAEARINSGVIRRTLGGLRCEDGSHRAVIQRVS